ncbi:hypothetical protein WUBG_04768, partial [Wuchereria bancrofti]
QHQKLQSDTVSRAVTLFQLECDLAEQKESSKENVCQLQKELFTCEQEKIVLKEQFENILQQFSALNEECSRCKDNEVELLENISQKELLIKELEQNIKSLMAGLECERHSHDKSIKDLQCELSQLQQENTAILTEKERVVFLFLMILIAKFHEELVIQMETISELKEKLHAKERQLSNVMQEMERVHNELRSKEEGRYTLENEALKLNKQNVELRKELDQLEKNTSQLKNDFEKEANLLKNSLEKCKKDKEESLSRLHMQLQTEKNRLKEISKDNEEKDEILKRINNDLKKANGDLNKLRILQSELEKKKTEWLQEKRALQERCLTAENDLEFERERAIVNKRNFDDVQTAIRELGRVNQNLQMDFAKQISRKWLEDSEAINCHTCDKPFTLTNRKHHCRQCGQIFCASCSSFTAKIASSRNPVRVCNACHEEIMHR